MDILDNLKTITKNSTRGGSVDYDIRHDGDGKFTVSDVFYAEHKLDENGFTGHHTDDTMYISIQPNEESVSFKGKLNSDAVKSPKFSSSTLGEFFDHFGLVGDLSLTHVGERDGATFFRVELINAPEQEETIETEINEEVVQ
jgi:hypothetical protein